MIDLQLIMKHRAVVSEKTNLALHALMKSPVQFFLTGSRYFGTASLSSDFDFYVQNSDEIKEYLIAEGFKLLSKSEEVVNLYGEDPNISHVLELGFVQVQLISDVEMKHTVQKILHATGTLADSSSIYHNKENNKRLWIAVYEYIQEYRGKIIMRCEKNTPSELG